MNTPRASTIGCSPRRLLHLLASSLAALAIAALLGCSESPVRLAAPGTEPHFAAQPVAQPRIALVLSAGSLRGFAHVGVIEMLEAHGIRADLVVGTSAGAIVGSLYAAGMNAIALRSAAQAVDFDLVSGLLSRPLGFGRSLVHGFVAQHLRGARIEALPMRFAVVATDLQDGCVAVFNAGDAAVAVQASAAMPGVFAPASIGGREYADGGIVSPLPVRVARALGAEIVIAVDVTFDPRESQLSSTVDRLFQTALVMIKAQARREARDADVLIEPILPPETEVTLENREVLIAAGKEAARASLPGIRARLAKDGTAPQKTGSTTRDVGWCRHARPMQTANALLRGR